MFLTSRIFRRFKLFNLPRVVVRHNCILAREPSISNARRHAELLLCPCHSRNLVNKSLSEPCWKCGSTEKGTYFFCEHCKALQKPDDNANYFHLLGAHESFDINLSDLSKKYRQLQSVLHPDKFSNATDEEKQFSADLSSYVNKAYRTLSDPLERGLYLLRLQGVPVHEENTSHDNEFLLKVMELNEELESITALKELNEFNSRNKETLKIILLKVSQSFSSLDKNSAKAALMEMKYFTTLESKVKEKQLLLEKF